MRLCDRCIAVGFVFLCPEECNGACEHYFVACPDDCDGSCGHGTAVCPECKGFGFVMEGRGVLICLN